MLKVFLTGDNHLGLKYAKYEQAATIIAGRMSAFEKMVEQANREKCDLFVIAGDLFENTTGISKREMKSLLEMLSCFKGTVVVLPGNHDYYDKESKVWKNFREVMDNYDNILLLTEYRYYSLPIGDEKVVLYPALCTSLHSEPGQNNIGWIREQDIPDDGTYRIGIAHGAVEGETIDNEGQYFLMRRDELESIPVDAWLIGHTHVPFPKNLTEKFATCGKIFNAGTHVQTDVSCNTEGQCFIIKIDSSKKVSAKKVVSGNMRFHRLTVACTAGNMEEQICRALEDFADESYVDLILTGAVTMDEYEDRMRIAEKYLDRFMESRVNDNALSKLITRELIESEFPETSFSAQFLLELIEQPKEAQMVYEMLKELKEKK